MAAVLRYRAFGCHVVRARPIFRRSDRKLDLDGECRLARNRCLVRLPALALASWVQTKLLFTSNLFCNGVWNRLDRVYLRCRIPARSKRLAGFLVMGRSGSADVDGSLALCMIRGQFPCLEDTKSVGRRGAPSSAR